MDMHEQRVASKVEEIRTFKFLPSVRKPWSGTSRKFLIQIFPEREVTQNGPNLWSLRSRGELFKLRLQGSREASCISTKCTRHSHAPFTHSINNGTRHDDTCVNSVWILTFCSLYRGADKLARAERKQAIFPTFYENWSFITTFTSVHHLSLH